MTENNLNRFIDAQKNDYQKALSEITNGRKQSHWMWYIFPQIDGLAFSSTSKFYAIKNLDEAQQYLNHPVLGTRLIEISNALLKLKSRNPNQILGSPDDLKLKSSMTLFASLSDTKPVFQKVLNEFFNGTQDDKTLQIINNH